MIIEELNIIISDIEVIRKSVYINVDIDNNILPRMEFGIQLYETFPNESRCTKSSTPFK
jgi:hypothetical protein